MIDSIKKLYRKSSKFRQKLSLYWSVNWIKTVYFNFRKFPFRVAVQMPVFFYGKIKLENLSGKIIINAPIKRGMIGYGQRFEKARKSKGSAEIALWGTWVINGHAHIGKDVFLFIGHGAYCEFGDMTCLGSDVKLICSEKIVLGNWARIGFDSQIIDTNAHQMRNTLTGENYPITKPIHIGNYNSISNRVSIMANTKTPDYCVIASNSVCLKDYTDLGNEILLGGVPAKLIKTHYTRDWVGEEQMLRDSLIIW